MPMALDKSAKASGAAQAVYSCPVCPTSMEADATCEHGTAMDVHCCNCHGGLLFDSASCVCELTEPCHGMEDAACETCLFHQRKPLTSHV